MIKINYCKKCVYPETAVNLSLNEDGLCSACEAMEYHSNEIEEGFCKTEKLDLKNYCKNKKTKHL